VFKNLVTKIENNWKCRFQDLVAIKCTDIAAESRIVFLYVIEHAQRLSSLSFNNTFSFAPTGQNRSRDVIVSIRGERLSGDLNCPGKLDLPKNCIFAFKNEKKTSFLYCLLNRLCLYGNQIASFIDSYANSR
jgi:hypothetical protein